MLTLQRRLGLCALLLAFPAMAADPARLSIPHALPEAVTRPLGDALGHALGRPLSRAGTSDAAAVLLASGTDSATRKHQPAGLFGTAPMVLLARPDMTALDGASLIAAAKASNGAMRIAHAGEGSPSETCARLFMEQVGPLNVVVADPVAALTENRADVACIDALGAVPMARAGSAVAHIVAAEDRLAALWDVPTGPELGLPLFTASSWFALYAPGADDAPKAHAGLQAYLAVDANVQALADAGMTPFPMTHRSIDAHRAFVDGAIR